MSRVPVYSNPELTNRLRQAYSEVKNCSRLCTYLRHEGEQGNSFRLKHGLDQNSINQIFENTGIKAPQISHVSLATLKGALDEDKEKATIIPNKEMEIRVVGENPVLREHQSEALKELVKAIRRGVNRGKIILPTGTGKTRIEAETIELLVKLLSETTEVPGIYVVLAPRILLTYQLLDVVGKIVTADKLECGLINVNSGEFDSVRFERTLQRYNIDIGEIESTTNVEDIKNKITKMRAENKTLLIFSTYHSVGRVNEAVQQTNSMVDAYIYDEAQYCVTNGEFQEIPEFPSNYKFFFTATEKNTDDAENGIGMNNEGIFGKVVYTKKPKALIEKGEMVSVAIHLVGAREHVDDNNYESKARVVIEAFDSHREVLKQHSAFPDLIGPKMLVVCDSQDSLKGILRSKELKKYKQGHPWVQLYALSSDYGIHISGMYTPKATNQEKEKLLAYLNDLEDTDEAIVLHVDMLAEGIDVPGITGIMPFRNLGKIKFLQNLGRGTRLVDLDRKSLYAGETTPKDWKKYVKPFCWVILPVLSDNSYDAKRRFTDYVYALRSEYEFDTSELIVIDNIKGPTEEQELPDITGTYDHKFRMGTDIISQIIHEIEESEQMIDFMDHAFEFKKLTEDEQAKLIGAIYAAN